MGNIADVVYIQVMILIPFPMPDLSGHTAIVTGANSGIGAAVAHVLGAHNAHVVYAVRDVAKGRQAAASAPGSNEVRRLDLADLASIRAFADNWTGSIDLLINNAGLSTKTLQRTKDGFEPQFGTNHLGPFALTNLLLPHITGRVVTLSSQAERSGRLDFDDLNWERTQYNGTRAYNNSKLANLLFTSALQRRLDASKSSVRANAAHPGFVATNIYTENTSTIAKLSIRLIAQDAEHGALPVLYAARGRHPR